MKSFSLFIAFIIFALMAVAHGYRFVHKIPVTIGTHSIPMEWSIYGCIIAIILALWMLLAMRSR